jgi:hypothetical protein
MHLRKIENFGLAEKIVFKNVEVKSDVLRRTKYQAVGEKLRENVKLAQIANQSLYYYFLFSIFTRRVICIFC